MGGNDTAAGVLLVGAMAGKVLGRPVAIEAIGGWEYIRENSDISFTSLQDMAKYLYVHNSAHRDYRKVQSATYVFYPDLERHMHSMGSRVLAYPE